MSHFIELKNAFGSDKTVEINSMFIESMFPTERGDKTFTQVTTFSGARFDVIETPKEIKKLMETKKITYFNQQP
jgi:hypothetical protein